MESDAAGETLLAPDRLVFLDWCGMCTSVEEELDEAEPRPLYPAAAAAAAAPEDEAISSSTLSPPPPPAPLVPPPPPELDPLPPPPSLFLALPLAPSVDEDPAMARLRDVLAEVEDCDEDMVVEIWSG